MTKTKLTLSPESPAYRLFLEELDKHVLHALGHLGASALVVSADQARQLGASFHTIRGSAGFFGLDDIAHISQMLEEHLFDVADGGVLEASRAAQWIVDISELAKRLPRG